MYNCIYLTDNRTHYYLGYNLFIEGCSGDDKKQFVVAVSENQLIKGSFQIDDVIEGTAWTKIYEEREFADYYKAGSLKLLERAAEKLEITAPPWIMTLPTMDTYKDRGARLLSKSLWKTKCISAVLVAIIYFSITSCVEHLLKV